MTDDLSVSVLVAEPAPLVADVMVTSLRAAGYDATFTGAVAGEVVAAAEQAAATVVVAGPSLGRAGLAAGIRELLARSVRTVLVSPDRLDRVDAEIMLAGASGHLSAASSDIAALPAEVARVSSGSSPLHPDVVREMLRQWRDARAVTSDESEVTLTPREVDVVRGLRDGLTTRLLAARLGVSEKTVEAHKSRLFAKVGAKNASQALQLVGERGLG